MKNIIQLDPDDFLVNPKKSSFPSLLQSDEIDSDVKQKRDEIERTAEKPGAEISSPSEILSVRFSHILARVQEFWGNEEQLDVYFEKLMIMDRNNRAGFPKPVMSALLDLWNIHRQEMMNPGTGDFSWCTQSSLHKAFKKIDQEWESVKKKQLTGAEAFLLDRDLTDAANLKAAQDHLDKNAKPVFVSHDTSTPSTLSSLSTLSKLLGD